MMIPLAKVSLGKIPLDPAQGIWRVGLQLVEMGGQVFIFIFAFCRLELTASLGQIHRLERSHPLSTQSLVHPVS